MTPDALSPADPATCSPKREQRGMPIEILRMAGLDKAATLLGKGTLADALGITVRALNFKLNAERGIADADVLTAVRLLDVQASSLLSHARKLRGVLPFPAEAIRSADAAIGALNRAGRQEMIAQWCAAAFGAAHTASVPQRGIRLAEEAIEAAQAAGCERDMLHRLVDYIFERPAGDLAQELGGVGLTVLALADAAKLDADACEIVEARRVLAKPIDHFAQRNAEKNAAGFQCDGAGSAR